jgi:hypothetical protein
VPTGCSGGAWTTSLVVTGVVKLSRNRSHAVVTMAAETDITNASGVSDLLTALAGESPEVITADMTATMF